MFGRKKSIVSVIKYEGPQDVFVWKYPEEDFNTKSQLIVHESQEAIFFRNGQALDSFEAGRYSLDTQNIPMLRKIVGIATGNVSPFHCEVYYINKAVSMGIPWGTDSPINIIDFGTNVPVELTGYGDFSLRVENGRKLLTKLVGTVKQYTQKEISRYFRGIISANIRYCIADTLEKKQISVRRIDTQLLALSAEIKFLLSEVFADYGLALTHFVVSGVKVQGLEKIGEAERETEITRLRNKAENAGLLERGRTEAEINRVKGITEEQNRAFDVAVELARNPGTDATVISSPVIGGATYGTVQRTMVSPAANTPEIVRDIFEHSPEKERCQTLNDSLRTYKKLLDEGIITEADFTEVKNQLLGIK